MSLNGNPPSENQKQYRRLPIGTHQPGLVVILIDQSESMKEPYGKASKDEFAALSVNRCIYEIMNACKLGDVYRDRCHIVVIGYGAYATKAKMLVAGRPSELDRQKKRDEDRKTMKPGPAGHLVETKMTLPIWVDAQAENGTPMEAAFDLASELIEVWIKDNHKDNFPPIVINITDGDPNDAKATEKAANRLMNLQTSDGKVLLFNAHIAVSAAGEIILPSEEKALPNDFAKLMFRISSVIPDPLHAAAVNSGFKPGPNARGFVMNANPDTLTKLLVFGSTHLR